MCVLFWFGFGSILVNLFVKSANCWFRFGIIQLKCCLCLSFPKIPAPKTPTKSQMNFFFYFCLFQRNRKWFFTRQKWRIQFYMRHILRSHANVWLHKKCETIPQNWHFIRFYWANGNPFVFAYLRLTVALCSLFFLLTTIRLLCVVVSFFIYILMQHIVQRSQKWTTNNLGEWISVDWLSTCVVYVFFYI